MRSSNDESLKDVIERIFNNNRLGTKLKETKIISKWEQLVGPMIASHTKKIYFKEDKLFIHVDSSVLRQELTFSKEKLIEIVNNEVGAEMIREINIR